MKKSQIKLLIFELVIFSIFIVNSFIKNVLGSYQIALILAGALVLFKILFGFEKDRHRFSQDMIFDLIIFLLIFFILFYFLGLFIGFARVENYYSWYGMKTFVIPLILNILIKEYLRYMMLSKSEGSKVLISLSTIMFIFIDLSNTIYLNDFNTNYNIFIFFALYFLPSVSSNVSYAYISYNVGYKPVLLYSLVMELYVYLIPIIPNPDKYLTSVLKLVLPALFALHVFDFLREREDLDIERNYSKESPLLIIIPVFLMIVMVYFTSGYFHYYAIAVATGSMEPVIYKGDVVVIEKVDKKFSELEVGDVIAYRYDNLIIVHRLSRIINKDGKYIFYTKGDANNAEDAYAIDEEWVIGEVRVKIPFIGLPTVWLNEL